MDISKLDFNAICLAHDSIFKFPSSYLMQSDAQEVMVRQEINRQTTPGRTVQQKYFLADLNPKKE